MDFHQHRWDKLVEHLSVFLVLAPVSVYLLLSAALQKIICKNIIVAWQHLVLPPASVYSKYNWLQLQMETYTIYQISDEN